MENIYNYETKSNSNTFFTILVQRTNTYVMLTSYMNPNLVEVYLFLSGGCCSLPVFRLHVFEVLSSE